MNTCPWILTLGATSIMRLMHLRSVVLPEPAGPMIPKIWCVGISRLRLSSAVLAA